MEPVSARNSLSIAGLHENRLHVAKAAFHRSCAQRVVPALIGADTRTDGYEPIFRYLDRPPNHLCGLARYPIQSGQSNSNHQGPVLKHFEAPLFDGMNPQNRQRESAAVSANVQRRDTRPTLVKSNAVEKSRVNFGHDHYPGELVGPRADLSRFIDRKKTANHLLEIFWLSVWK